MTLDIFHKPIQKSLIFSNKSNHARSLLTDISRFNFIFLHFILGLGILFFSNSCILHRLDVQTQYLTPEYLASYHIGTPDPALYEPMVGQRLLIQWSLCANEVEDHELFLHLRVRFCNHEETEIKVPITSKRGTYIYHVNHELYYSTKGIFTYFAEIRSDSCTILATWKHPLWTELIHFNFSDNS